MGNFNLIVAETANSVLVQLNCSQNGPSRESFRVVVISSILYVFGCAESVLGPAASEERQPGPSK